MNFGLGRAARPPRSLAPILVALACLVPLAVLILYLGRHSQEMDRVEGGIRLQDAARNIAIAVDARLGAGLSGLAVLAESESLRGPLDIPAFIAQARPIGAALGGIVLLYGPTPDRAPLANTSAAPDQLRTRIAEGGLAGATASLVERIDRTGQPGLSDLFIAPVNPRPIFTMGIAVPQDPRPGRRLHLTVEAGLVGTLLRRVGIPPGAIATVLDGQGITVASSDPNGRPGRATGLPWIAERLGERSTALLDGVDAEGHPVLVAVERLAIEPRWMVTLVTHPPHAFGAMLGSGWHVAGLSIGGMAIVAVAWAMRRARLLDAVAETSVLREAQRQADRVLAGLPAVLAVRIITPEGEAGPLLYRAGDIEGVTGWPEEPGRDALRGDLAEHPEEMRAFRQRLVREGKATLDWRMLQPDGRWRWMRWTSRRLETRPDGSIIGVGYVADISAERASQAQAQAAGRLASMAEMAHGLAHELKQPLQAITLQAEVAQAHLGRLRGTLPDGTEPRQHAEAAAIALAGIADQAVRTGNLVEHLRRFARGSGEDAPAGPVDLSAALADALLLVGRGLQTAGITLDTELGDPSPLVLGNGIGIEQILINLLNNARDAFAGRDRNLPRRIRIHAARSTGGDHVILTVADTAGGVPEHILDRIFEPFVTTKAIDDGTGLGLAICHGLARSMGAEITAENGAEGAIFTVRFLAAESGMGG